MTELVNQNNSFILTDLTWDSEYFGISCAKCEFLRELNENKIAFLLNKICGYEFVTIVNPIAFHFNNEIFGTYTDAFLVDTNIGLSRKVVKEKYIKPDYIQIEKNKPFSQEIVDIAKSSSVCSRYLIDSHIKKEKGSGVYLNSVINSSCKADNYYFSCLIDGRIAGVLLALEKSPYELQIELLLVSPDFQEQDIGVNLIKSLISFAFNEGYKEIKVETQLENPIFKLYSTCGFEISGIKNIYHLWNM